MKMLVPYLGGQSFGREKIIKESSTLIFLLEAVGWGLFVVW
jgi:hypothetical protein